MMRRKIHGLLGLRDRPPNYMRQFGCASGATSLGKIQIVRPSRSRAETQPQTPSGFAEIVGDYFLVLHHLELCSRHCLLFNTSPNDSEQHDGNDSSPSQESFMESKLT